MKRHGVKTCKVYKSFLIGAYGLTLKRQGAKTVRDKELVKGLVEIWGCSILAEFECFRVAGLVRSCPVDVQRQEVASTIAEKIKGQIMQCKVRERW